LIRLRLFNPPTFSVSSASVFDQILVEFQDVTSNVYCYLSSFLHNHNRKKNHPPLFYFDSLVVVMQWNRQVETFQSTVNICKKISALTFISNLPIICGFEHNKSSEQTLSRLAVLVVMQRHAEIGKCLKAKTRTQR
jgi:hypothetical protein